MKRNIHAAAASLALLFLIAFWASTLIAEMFLPATAVTQVKKGIAYALLGFIPVMIVTGASGFAMGGKSAHPLIAAKRRRMRFIGGIGLLVLAPAAIFLSVRAQGAVFDSVFYGVQALELVAVAVNVALISLNFRDGLRLRFRQPDAA